MLRRCIHAPARCPLTKGMSYIVSREGASVNAVACADFSAS